MAIAFDLWGQRGWMSFDVAGESYHEKEIRALLGNVRRSDPEVIVQTQLHPEPTNRHDPNAIAVWSGPHHLGYLPRDEAPKYVQILSALVGQGWTPQVAARIWSFDHGDGDFQASVRLDLAEPHLLVPANMPPSGARRLLPMAARSR